MNKIRQYRPNFVTSDELLEVVEFDGLAELVAIPFVAGWIAADHFIKLSIARGERWQREFSLMGEMTDGKWVIGFVDNDLPELPAYEPSSILPRWQIDSLAS